MCSHRLLKPLSQKKDRFLVGVIEVIHICRLIDYQIGSRLVVVVLTTLLCNKKNDIKTLQGSIGTLHCEKQVGCYCFYRLLLKLNPACDTNS